ncbi:MAG: aspartate/glutamate racemase family protein [Ornithinimicrobium sp.]
MTFSQDTSLKPSTPIGSIGVGVIAPYDFALDRELWRWVPDPINLLLTRTPHHILPVSITQAETVSDTSVLTECARTLVETSPDVVAYACTSGSFVRGLSGEASLRHAIEMAGVPRALTTSGALLQAVAALGVRRLAVATPYDDEVTARLGDFLAQAGVQVVSTAAAGLSSRIWALPYPEVARLWRSALPASGAGGADAVFMSCTNVPTLDLIEPLEAELGIPMLSANQVTLWAALAAVGVELATSGQALAQVAAPRHRPGAFGS